MSTFGSFGNNNFLSGSNNQAAQFNPFGDFQGLLRGEANNSQFITPPGYNYNPFSNMMERKVGGITYKRQPRAGGLTGSEQFQGAALADYVNLVKYNDQNRAERSEANKAFRDETLENAAGVRSQGEESRDKMFEFAQGLADKGDAFRESQRALADEAVNQYEVSGVAVESSLAAGAKARASSARAAHEAGAKAGNPEDISQLAQIEMDMNRETQGLIGNYARSYNEGLFGANMQRIASLGQAEGIASNFDQMATGAYSAGIQVAEAATARAAQMESMGLKDYANMVASNPYSPVAFLPTLMSFFQFSSSKQAGQFSGFSPEILFGGTRRA